MNIMKKNETQKKNSKKSQKETFSARVLTAEGWRRKQNPSSKAKKKGKPSPAQ